MLIDFRDRGGDGEREREREKEREMSMWKHPPDRSHNLGMCLDWEPNL